MLRAFAVVTSFLFLFSGNALAQKYEPQVGQAGKDVIWVPTPDEVVDRMLTMAQVGPGDIHFDLGAGDGKIAIAAAKRGANATGIEYNPDMAKYANERAKAAGVAGTGAGKATIRQADIFATDFSHATVITLYLLPDLNVKLVPQLKKLNFDTASMNNPMTFGALLKLVPPTQVMFGSDFPWGAMAHSRNPLRDLGLSAEDILAIEEGNARKMFARFKS